MKRLLFGLLAVTSMSLATGCSCVGKGGPCADGCGGPGGCGPGGCAAGGGCGQELDPCHPRMRPLMRHHGRNAGDNNDYGPPSAAIAYPYYTTRGPRDYFDANPPSIGR